MSKRTIIDFEGSNEVLFWKSPVESLGLDSVIIVPETHTAVFVKDGRLLETLEAGRYEIFDKKSKFFGLFRSREDVLSVKVIYISKTAKLLIKWGTANKFDFRDPQYGIPVKVGACGTFETQVADPRKFYLEVVGADRLFTVENLRARLHERLISEIEPVIAQTMREKQISYDMLSEYKPMMAAAIKPELSRVFEKEYGLTMYSFTLVSVLISEEDKAALEARRNAENAKKELRENKDEHKKEIDEIMRELERLDDKNFDRTLALKKLESLDYEKYLEVVKPTGKYAPEGNAAAKEADKSMQNVCVQCGAALAQGAKFCNQCGTAVATCKVCTACGSENPLVSNWCGNCGKKL